MANSGDPTREPKEGWKFRAFIDVPDPETGANVRTDITHMLATVYEMATHSMDWGSGFLDSDEMVDVAHLGRLANFDLPKCTANTYAKNEAGTQGLGYVECDLKLGHSEPHSADLREFVASQPGKPGAWKTIGQYTWSVRSGRPE